MSELDKKESSFKSGLTKIKAFLQRQRWREASIFLAFVLLSFGFWLLQSLQQEYEMEITIPVRYKNLPADITFVNEAPDRIMVRIRDKGTVLMNYSFGRKFAPIESNMKNRIDQSDSGAIVITKKDIESEIQKQLIATTTLIDFEPYQIDINYSKRAQKEIAVIFDGKIELQPGFKQFGNITIDPSTVLIYAADALLDTIYQIQTQHTEIKNANKTIVKTIPLVKIKNTATDPEMVTITIPVEEFAEKILEIPVVCTEIPDKYIVRIFPSSVKVSTTVPLSRFKDLMEEQFAIHIPFDELEQNLSGIVPIDLTHRPDWINQVTLSPNKIEFIIEEKKEIHD